MVHALVFPSDGASEARSCAIESNASCERRFGHWWTCRMTTITSSLRARMRRSSPSVTGSQVSHKTCASSSGGLASGKGEATLPRPRESAVNRLVVLVVSAPVRIYQRLISPALPRRCKYEPTCSAYALGAIRAYGPARGLVLSAWRLLRCNPFSHGGYDPPEAQTLFRARSSRGRQPKPIPLTPKAEG